MGNKLMSVQSSQTPALKIPKGMLQGAANALRHWHEHRPKMYSDLHRQGKLFEAANTAWEATVDDSMEIESALVKQGYEAPTAFVIAQQATRERYIYLPTEEDVPDLMRTEAGIYIYQPEQSG